jgi:hypothetical protein
VTTLKLASPSSVNGYIGGSRYVIGWIRFFFNVKKNTQIMVNILDKKKNLRLKL